MSHEITTALAAPFTWTPDGSYDIRLAFASGASPVTATVDTGTYRMNLAPTSGSVRDFLRRLETRINAALATAARAETVTVAITSRGRVTVTLSSGVATWTVTSTLRDTLGLSSTSFSSVASIAGTEIPAHLYLFLGGESAGWSPEEAIASSMTNGGTALAIRSGVRTWVDEFALEFIPSDPSYATEQEADWSPWEPGSTTLPWSLRGLLDTGLAQTCGWSVEWQRVRDATDFAFDVVTIDPKDLARPRVTLMVPGLLAWRSWTVRLVRSSTKTRA